MMRKRASGDDETLSEQRKSLIERYMIDAAEAHRREQLAAETGEQEVEEQSRRGPPAEPKRDALEHAEPTAGPLPRLASRSDPPEVPSTPERPASYSLASFSARQRYLLLVGSTALAAALYATNWHSPVRVAVTVVFVLFLPGLALAELAPLADAAERLVVGIGASLALETLLAVAFLYAGFFTPGRVFAVTLLVTVGFTAIAALRARQS
jgi:hypothetical protein